MGIGGMAGSMLIPYQHEFRFAVRLWKQDTNEYLLGFQGKPAGYFIIFCVCAVSYLIGWCIMKALVQVQTDYSGLIRISIDIQNHAGCKTALHALQTPLLPLTGSFSCSITVKNKNCKWRHNLR